MFNQKFVASAGLNKVDYNLDMPKSIAEKWNKKDKSIKITPAENGLYYLPAGTYKIKLIKENQTESTTFEIIESKK